MEMTNIHYIVGVKYKKGNIESSLRSSCLLGSKQKVISFSHVLVSEAGEKLRGVMEKGVGPRAPLAQEKVVRKQGMAPQFHP